MKRILLLVAALCLFFVASAQTTSDCQKGLDAYNAGDYKEAVKWYRKAADQGDAEAQNRLGFCYRRGLGVKQNNTEAVKWYRKAAEQGHAQAQSNLGYCYYSGYGVTKDYTEAVKWYQKAAEQSSVDAYNNLGVCYEYGNGVTKDYAEAIRLYRKAAEQGHAKAKQNMEALLAQQNEQQSQNVGSNTFMQQIYHDAAMFNVHKGNVKCIKYGDKTVNFSEDGKLLKDESSYLKMYSKYDILRGKDGYPIELITDFDKTKFEYDDEKRISKRIISAGNSTIIFAYEYGESTISITRIESVAGQPKNNVTVYDMNGFDFRGNWIQKGIEGTQRKETNVKTDYTLGNATNQYAVNTWTSVDYKYYYEGREQENRVITYWSTNARKFTRSNSDKELNLFNSVYHAFFFNVGNSAKAVEKYVKQNKIEVTRKETIYGSLEMSIPSSDYVFYGFPIVNMRFQYYKNHKYGNAFRYIVLIEDEAEREDFMDFLCADAIKNGTFKESGIEGLHLQNGILEVYIVMTNSGIEIRNANSVSFWAEKYK
ncbi:MAG: sel1 repeat family protein [Alistipes sp.]|nr:sel1 repeat family protein [Alistipes sp.]